MLWATDAVGMSILLDPRLARSVGHKDGFGSKKDPVGLTPCYSDWKQAVHAEVGTTELIRSQGYDVDVLMTAYRGFHGSHEKSGIVAYCSKEEGAKDHFTVNGYFGSNIHPYETVFVKANRDIDLTQLDHMTTWHMNMDHTAWNMCGP